MYTEESKKKKINCFIRLSIKTQNFQEEGVKVVLADFRNDSD